MKRVSTGSSVRSRVSFLWLCLVVLVPALGPGSGTVYADEVRDIRIVAPYLGPVTNLYEPAGQDQSLKDSSRMIGLYLQWINTERYQWNAFLYQASDINHAELLGLHLNLDLYYDLRDSTRNVIGGGLEYISLDIDAGDTIDPLEDFELNTVIWVPFFRTGRQFFWSPGPVNLTVFPWFGFEFEFVRGEFSAVMPPEGMGPPVPVEIEEKIHEDYVFPLYGLNLRAEILRFLQIDAKYSAAFNADTFLPRFSLMTNLFFTRRYGLSYRYSYTETTVGYTQYHLFGVAAVF